MDIIATVGALKEIEIAAFDLAEKSRRTWLELESVGGPLHHRKGKKVAEFARAAVEKRNRRLIKSTTK